MKASPLWSTPKSCIRAPATPPLTAANSRAAPAPLLSAAPRCSTPGRFPLLVLASSAAMILLQALLLGYLLGTIPFGLFFTWVSGAGDVRKIGSGNIGATNVLRTGKKWAAAATLLC